MFEEIWFNFTEIILGPASPQRDVLIYNTSNSMYTALVNNITTRNYTPAWHTLTPSDWSCLCKEFPPLQDLRVLYV